MAVFVLLCTGCGPWSVSSWDCLPPSHRNFLEKYLLRCASLPGQERLLCSWIGRRFAWLACSLARLIVCWVLEPSWTTGELLGGSAERPYQNSSYHRPRASYTSGLLSCELQTNAQVSFSQSRKLSVSQMLQRSGLSQTRRSD